MVSMNNTATAAPNTMITNTYFKPSAAPNSNAPSELFVTDEDTYEVCRPRGRPFLAAPTDDVGLEPGCVPWSCFDVSGTELGKGEFGNVYAGYVCMWTDHSNSWEWKQAAIKVLKSKCVLY